MHTNASPTVIIAGISSDIGAHIARRYRDSGAHVFGTARSNVEDALHVDINDGEDIKNLQRELTERNLQWDVLIVSIGVLDPIGPFLSTSFAAWETSYRINSIAQWELLHALHGLRRPDATVIFFAGGAVNGVLERYSQYGLAKIALIKMAEYLQSEDPTTRYAVLGPGWVATKIHEQTMAAETHAGANLQRTAAFTTNSTGTSLDDIFDCVRWVCDQPMSLVGGRNFSVVHDAWGTRPGHAQLLARLSDDPQAFKLRRSTPSLESPTRTIARIFDAIPTIVTQHARDSSIYAIMEQALRPAIEALFSTTQGEDVAFGPFGMLQFPYVRMGAIDTLDLFGLDELLIFAFYWNNRNRYRFAADIGANLGLHSIIMARCGMHVQAYEPDPSHAAKLQANLERNAITTVDLYQAGVSDRTGHAEFVRVLGNTTSSHIAGSKVPYGELEHFEIALHDIREVARAVDFMKIDAEGHETVILSALQAADWAHCDAMVEIGNVENARNIYAHLKHLPIRCFSQKRGWTRVRELADLPTSYREGSLFITNESHDVMPWRPVSAELRDVVVHTTA